MQWDISIDLDRDREFETRFAACKSYFGFWSKAAIDHRTNFLENLHVLIENFHSNAEDTKWTFREMHRIVY